MTAQPFVWLKWAGTLCLGYLWRANHEETVPRPPKTKLKTGPHPFGVTKPPVVMRSGPGVEFHGHDLQQLKPRSGLQVLLVALPALEGRVCRKLLFEGAIVGGWFNGNCKQMRISTPI